MFPYKSPKKAVCAFLIVLVAGGLAFAETPTTVRFSYWASYEDNEMWKQVCDSFEQQNPDVILKREWYIGDYGRKLQLVMITGEAADIILMDDELFPAYQVRGYLEDLTPYIERESDTIEKELAAEFRYINTPKAERDPNYQRVYLNTALESFNYRGFQGGLPWDGNTVIIVYNRALFDAHNATAAPEDQVPYPHDGWTWDEFRDIAKKLSKDLDGDGHNDQFGTLFSFGFLGFEPFLWSFGGDVLNEDRTKCTMDQPRVIEAAQFMHDMKYEDRSIAWLGEMEGFNDVVQILTGRLAMYPAMSYLIPGLNRVKGGMTWNVEHMPIGPHGHRYTRVTWDGISINAKTTQEKKEIAWRFMKHLISPESQAIIGDLQIGMPARREQVLADYIKPETPAREEIALEATEYGRLTPITPRYMEINDAMRTEFNLLNAAESTGITPEEALVRLTQKVNAVLEKEQADWAEALADELGTGKKGGSGFMSLLAALGILAAIVAILGAIPPVRASFLLRCAEAKQMVRSKMARKEAIDGLIFAGPWLFGLLFLTAFPIIFSIILSFSEWDPLKSINTMQFIGLGNFARAFSRDPVNGDPLVLKALYNTFYYAIFAVPLGLTTSLGLAILLNQKVRGITIFRTTFYLPSIVAGVATVILWMYIFNPIWGPLNQILHWFNMFFDKTVILSFINLPEPKWLAEPAWGKPAMILMSLWGAGGGGMLIFLAGLQGVPDQLYEVAELDGAGRLRKFWNVTLPMLTPTIYFNFIMGIIGSLKVFMQAFIMTDGGGGVDYSLLFYVLHLYNKAFVNYEMGYASALAWILFSIILALTMLVIKSSSIWVYYEGERKGGK